uniref:AMP-dependent synthetase/ligase domain-containing protein n=1 Tax=Mucochytrium quahogii TaxID=96639 RepID=A0A7S2SLS7_9STRA|mmetsp:Transcript_20053/g.33107  ORF Transcript_20053/g.33107 Transcript_20053/m.33107 type:complete len:288 (+) Transcript_20053:54-917(+)
MLQFMRRRGFSTFPVRKVLEEQAIKFPTKNAVRLTEQDIRWTFAQLRDQSGAVGSGFYDVGLRPGDTVGVALGTNAEHVTVQLGGAAAGLRVASVTEGLTKEALAKMLKDQNVSVLVVSPEEVGTVYEVVPELQSKTVGDNVALDIAEYPSLRYVLQTGFSPMNGTYRFKDFLVYSPAVDHLSGLGPKDAKADIKFLVEIDGKTGGVKKEMSQQELLAAASKRAKELKMDADINVLFCANKDVASNLALGLIACTSKSTELVIPSSQYDEKAMIKANAQDKCAAEFS